MPQMENAQKQNKKKPTSKCFTKAMGDLHLGSENNVFNVSKIMPYYQPSRD